MEENEIVETTEAPVEETQEQVSEEVEEVADDLPTLEDYEKLKKEKETLAAQKEHWRKKAEEKKLAPQVETPQVSNDYLTREEGILLAQGYDQDDLDNLRRLAGNKKLTEVIEDPLFVAYQSQKKAKQRASKAQLGASTSSILKTSKPIEEMTQEEHKDLWLKTMGVK